VFSDIYFQDLARRPRAIMGKWLWVPVLVAGLFLGSIPYGPLRDTMFAWCATWLPAYQLQTVLHSLGALFLMVAVMTCVSLQRVLATRLSLFMGRISFALYLTHFLVLGSYTRYLFIALRHSFGYRSSVLLAFWPGLAVSICVAFLYAVYVDEPSICLAAWVKTRVAGLNMSRPRATRTPKQEPSVEATHRAVT
jgi:peptidoglycan/LPS O-acetylase OafA/YrhL